MPVTKRLRFEILRRDNHACRYCGASAPETALVVDHVVPVALGGSDEPTNLVAACAPCNSGKSATPADAAIVADVQADALRWSRAMAIAVSAQKIELDSRILFRKMFRDEIWDTWTYEYKGERKTVPLPDGWQDSIDRFYMAGIEEVEFREAVRLAMTRAKKDEFRYMCGVMWRLISERRDIAMEIVRGEEAGS